MLALPASLRPGTSPSNSKSTHRCDTFRDPMPSSWSRPQSPHPWVRDDIGGWPSHRSFAQRYNINGCSRMVDPRQTRSVSPAKSRPPPDYYPRPPRRPQQRMPPPNLDDYLTLEELEQTAPRRRLRYLAPPEVYDYYATERRFDVKPRPQQETKLAPPKLSNYLTVEQIQIEDVRGRRRDRGRRRPIPSMLDYLTLEQLEDHWVKQDTFKGAIDIPQRAQALDESPSFRSRQSPLRQVPKSRWHMPLSSHQEDEQTPRGPLPSP